MIINPQNKLTRKAAFAGGNIEWNQIPKSGDVYDFNSFYAYREGGKWFVACWSSFDALTAQTTLARLSKNTQARTSH